MKFIASKEKNTLNQFGSHKIYVSLEDKLLNCNYLKRYRNRLEPLKICATAINLALNWKLLKMLPDQKVQIYKTVSFSLFGPHYYRSIPVHRFVFLQLVVEL